MTDGRDILPHVLKVDAFGIHRVSMPPIIFHLSPTMTTCLNRCADIVERFWLALSVIKQAVVGGIQPFRDWQNGLHADCDPVAERQATFGHIVAQNDVPLWQVIKKERTSGLENADALVNPLLTPSDIFAVRKIVIASLTVLLAEIERRIGKHGVDCPIIDGGKNLQAIALEQPAKFARVYGGKI